MAWKAPRPESLHQGERVGATEPRDDGDASERGQPAQPQDEQPDSARRVQGADQVAQPLPGTDVREGLHSLLATQQFARTEVRDEQRGEKHRRTRSATVPLGTPAEGGLPVEHHHSGETRELPPMVDLTAYRIIQVALTLSPLTAKTHVSRTMTRLGARDRAQLVVTA
jgi:hypothetical protein